MRIDFALVGRIAEAAAGLIIIGLGLAAVVNALWDMTDV